MNDKKYHIAFGGYGICVNIHHHGKLQDSGHA